MQPQGLNNLQSPGRTSRKRLGRGTGSGLGTTAGRGTKGQNSRAGGGVRPRFEGGHTPLYRLLPKLRGFSSRFEKTVIVNVEELGKHFSAGDVVNLKALKTKHLIHSQAQTFKVLGQGQLDKKLTVYSAFVSKSAVKKIKDAGGSVITGKPSLKEPVKKTSAKKE